MNKRIPNFIEGLSGQEEYLAYQTILHDVKKMINNHGLESIVFRYLLDNSNFVQGENGLVLALKVNPYTFSKEVIEKLIKVESEVIT